MTTQTLEQPMGSPFTALIAKIRRMNETRKLRLRTERELSRLTDRELNDIGICRGMIPSIVMEISA